MFIPKDSFQLSFLKQIQRLFNEGEFVATYKFALLHSIADITLELEDDNDGKLHIPIKLLAEKFVQLYWNQSKPYATFDNSQTLVLQQNTGQQAAIIRILSEQQTIFKTYAQFIGSDRWRLISREIINLIKSNPLWRLQKCGNEDIEFLYKNNHIVNGAIVLNEGIAYCFRQFYFMLVNASCDKWVQHIRKIHANSVVIGSSDLESFLFETERSSLKAAQEFLQNIQHGNCFYCNRKLEDKSHVDHFVPWSRYQRDLGHNFVLTHDKCNSNKSDTLATKRHVEKWLSRNEENDRLILSELSPYFLCNKITSEHVAKWAYELDFSVDAQLWSSGGNYEKFDTTIFDLFFNK